MATYKVTLIDPDGKSQTIDCPDDVYILEAGEDAGMELPASCRSGNCSTCAGLVEGGTAGKINQDDYDYIDSDELTAKYVLTCAAYATADCTIYTGKEDELSDLM